MILSASRRTDIPAFYSQWLMQRLQEGFFLVRNPMNARQISRVSIHPNVVDCIVFWTKNLRPLLPHLPRIRELGYTFFVQYTINPYDRDLEPWLPSHEERIASFQEASQHFGRECLVWRYDPIVINPWWTVDRHKNAFANLAEDLAPFADECVFSFFDSYRKVQGRVQDLQLLADPRQYAPDIVKHMADTAAKYRLPINTCAEPQNYDAYGIGHASCIDQRRIERLLGKTLKAKKDPNQRPACGCLTAIDMGAYNTCHHRCVYCYANASPKVVQAHCAAHDPTSPLMTGTVEPTDSIKERDVASLVHSQQSLF